VAENLERLQAALADRYTIEHELGRGGSATVYLAQDLKHGRPVAIKVLHRSLGSAITAERFLREIRTAARLHHPHILPLFDSGEAEGRIFYTMPYVEGESLRSRIRREGCLPVEEAVRIAVEVADALQYAHNHAVIHRDIKPENILISRDGHILLADFGLAHALDGTSSDLTESGIAMGTPAYMSPEQTSGAGLLDGRTDIYSLGLVLYEMLAGEPPFTGPNPRAVMAKRLREPVPSISDARENIPLPLERALRKALAVVPADRFASPAELAMALNESITTEETEVVSSSPPPPARPRWRVRRDGVVALVVAAVVLLTMGAGIRWLYGVARGSSADEQKMLAVLPFKNLGEPADQYFTDGLTEEITSRLASLSGLGVISRTSADRFRGSSKSLREIGAELGAGYVLEGSVRWERAADGRGRIRVTPQLIRVRDDSHLWATQYDAELTEVLKVQAAIAEQVTSALDVALRDTERRALVQEPTKNSAAYDYYLRGKEYHFRGYDRENLFAAAELYGKAVESDSMFADAWARLSQAHSAVYWHYHDRSRERLEMAKQAADRAMALSPGLPEGHVALGYYYYYGFLDFDRAIQEFTAAYARQPNNSQLLAAMAYVERRQGRWGDAITHLNAALRLDPQSHDLAHNLADTYFSVRRYAEADRYLDRALSLAPDFERSWAYKAHLQLVWRGDLARAREILRDGARRLEFGALAASMNATNTVSGALMTADPAFQAMIDRLSAVAFEGDSARYFMLKAEANHFRGRVREARIYADSARAAYEDRLRTAAPDFHYHVMLSLAYAILGRNADAMREATRATEVLPISRDANTGPFASTNLARINMMVGNLDTAVVQLERLLTIPSWISREALRVDPTWQPLRAHPAFRRLLLDAA
jgi:serine/threonine-protein kinase